MKSVFLDTDSVSPADLDLSPLHRFIREWEMYGATSPPHTQARVQGARIVVSNKVVLDAELLAQTTGLQLICVAATGTNNVDLEAAREHGVVVCNARNYATASVVQHVFGLILALTTHLLDYQQVVREGRWHASKQFCLFDFPIRELAGKTLGILGYGVLGQAVAELGRAFGMHTLVWQRPGTSSQGGRLPLEQLLPRCDVVSLHCPLSKATRNLIGSPQLAIMRPDAILINTARGGIVDEQALADALRRRVIAGAGIDVLAEEPPRSPNPLLDETIPNLIVTPHIAWASRETRQRLINEVADNIDAFVAGQPRNVVTA